MKYKLNTVSGINSEGSNQKLHVFLVGEDQSQHNFQIDVSGRDVKSLTLLEIENLAIQHARQSFTDCN
ncbi:MAG: hypothetical protein PW844_17110 [Pantoea sp.]|uniref:hypothetical protein n=1 Tax=Pantoea sp. TaxID=69393 RepID=UPI0023824B6F|nr:hypothetical protein [Pantoea sp.]MDE1188186.1 hypothetical protein [Pantoea sp.]